MRWGKKKPSQNSSSRQSFMSHVFPTSWLMKFKHKNINTTNQKHAQETPKGKWNSSVSAANTAASPSITGGRFHGSEGDAFWRLSFGEDSFNARTNECVTRQVQHGFDDEPELSGPNCQSCRLNCKRVAGHGKDEKFRNMVCDVRKMKGIHRETDGGFQDKVVEIRTPRLIRNNRQKVVKFSEGSVDLIEREDCKLPAYESRINSVDSAENPPTPDWQKLKEVKIEELKLRNDQQRKSMYISRDSQKRRKAKQSVKLRAYSPRADARLETCRVKALEDMRKAKLKMRRVKEKALEEPSNEFDSFAVVKCSFDPHKDFKDSMIEMIKEKDIRRPEELEDLLACYLTLNDNEYHDLIIKVFRQVWFELNHSCADTELETKSHLL